MNSYHDYQIYGYEVDSLERRIKFKLAWPEENGKARITYIEFGGVYGYEMKNDSMVSVVLDFEEMELPQFLSTHNEEIKESYRQNGAYGPWAHNLDEAVNELHNNNVKAIVLSSSIGIEGWILAKNFEVKDA